MRIHCNCWHFWVEQNFWMMKDPECKHTFKVKERVNQRPELALIVKAVTFNSDGRVYTVRLS